MKTRGSRVFFLAACLVIVFGISPVLSQTPSQTPLQLPKMVRVATSTVGSGTYAKATIFSGLVKKASGVDVRIMPNDSQIGVALTMRAKEMDCTYYTGTGMFYLAHGLDVFGAPEWGPQPVRASLMGMSGCGFAVPAKSNIKSWEDMKGKRVAISPGTPLVEDATLAFLAYGGVGKADVKQIVVSGMNGAYSGLLDGTVDGAYLPFEGSAAYNMEGSPRGLRWLPMDPGNEEGWKRLQKYLPMYAPFLSKTGAGCSEERPIVGGGYALGYFAYRDASPDIMFILAKSIYEGYDAYKDISKDLKYWDNKMLLDYEAQFLPLHEGTVRYLKGVGKWTPEMERWQAWKISQETGRLEAWPLVVKTATEKKIKIGSPEFMDLWKAYLQDNNLLSTPGKVPAGWKP